MCLLQSCQNLLDVFVLIAALTTTTTTLAATIIVVVTPWNRGIDKKCSVMDPAGSIYTSLFE